MTTLSSESPAGPRATGAALRRSPLLGRRFELRELVEGLEDARAGRGRLFLLSGDAGIGKTRLAEALAEQAETTDARVRWGQCWEGGGAPPYWPWVQILRSELADMADVAAMAEGGTGALERTAPYLAQLVPELGGLVEPADSQPALDLPGVREALFDAVVTFLRERSAEAPRLLILEDLHAADDVSLRLLQALARELASASILVVGTYRDPEVRSSPTLHQRMSALARKGRRIAMTGLDEDTVAALLERTAGEGAGEAAREVYHLTDGNPFFVQEVGRLLAAEPQATRTGEVRVPEEVHALIRRRLEPVPEDVRRVLTLAAVLGRNFELVVLAQLGGEAPASLLDVLDRATALHVLEESGLGRWSFSHGLMAEALYDEVRPSRRVSLHRQAGEALAASHGEDDGRVAPQLAHHFFEAARGGDGTKAVHYCQLAGEGAMAALAFEEAAALYGRALEALALTAPVDEGRRFEVLMALGQAQQRGGDLPLARETYQRALKSARMLGSPERLARAAIAYTGFVESTPEETRTSVLEEALAALPPGDSPLRARLLTLLGYRVQVQRFATADVARRNEERGARLAAEGVEMARRLGDPETLWAVLWDWHFPVAGVSATLGERLRVADELVALATRAGNAERLVLARQWRAFDLYALGDIEAMAQEIEVAREEAARLRTPFLLWGVVMEEAGLALLRGELEEAERLAREALAYGERAEFFNVEGAFRAQLAEVRRHQGRFAEVEELLSASVSRDITSGKVWCRWTVPATISAWSGRTDEARRAFEGMIPAVAQQGLARVPTCCLAHLSELSWALGAPELASDVLAAFSPSAGNHITRGIANFSLGAADRHLGQMAALLGRYDKAEASFEAAARVHARIGSPLWDAYSRADHARMLLMRGDPDDRRRAAELAEEAGATFRALGMGFQEERAAALLQGGEVDDVGAVTAPAADRARLSLEGEYWAFDYGGTTARLRDSKGVRYLAQLLRNPGQEHHALDLVSGKDPGARRAGDAGAVLDPQAKEAYRRRLGDLREELDEATAFNDLGRAERAQVEIDRLIAELTSAVGLGGRDRQAASASERARQSVTRAVKGTIERLADANPALGDHLRSTIRTGVYSAYVPDPRAPLVWE